MQEDDDFEKITLLSSLLRKRLGGLLTVYYPEGLDIMNPAEEQTEKLAQKITEPVQLVFQSPTLGKVFCLYIPDKFDQDKVKKDRLVPRGGWLRAYSYNQRRVFTEKEIELYKLFSGAPDVAPWYILDVGVGFERDRTEDRLMELNKKIGDVVIAEFNGDILHSDLLDKRTSPLRPEERRQLHEDDCAKTLLGFSDGRPGALAFPAI